MTTESQDPDTRDLLQTAVPAPDAGPHESWADVLHRSGVARERRRRRVLLAAALAGLVLATGAALAAVAEVPWWEDAAPPVNPKVLDWQLAPPADGTAFPPRADRSRARTVATEDGAALVAAPVGQGGYCVIPSLPGDPDLGFSCVYQLSDEFRSYARPPSAGTPRWIIYGRITDPDAATLDLSEAARVPFEVELQRGGFFLANVPEGRWDELSGRAGEGRILDASGETLRTGCVNWGPSPHAPAAGLSRWGFWSEGREPCLPQPVPTRPKVDLDKARKLVALRLSADFSIWTKGTTVAVWRAPTLDGNECTFVAPASPRPSGVSEGVPGGPSICGPPASRRLPSEDPFGTMSFSVAGGGLIEGEVDRSSGIVRIALRSRTGSTTLPFNNGHFLGQLPEDGSRGEFPRGGPFVLVGYDAAGKEVARADLEKRYAQGSPR
jgi:hypothetical protein